MGRAPDASIVGLIDDADDGSVVGYARTTFRASDHALRAADLRFEMRSEAGGWRIVAMERRHQCDSDTATELCR